MNNTKIIKINNKDYWVNENEFTYEIIPKYNTLKIIKNVGLYERFGSFLSELLHINENMNDIFFNNITHGGYIFIEMINMIKEMKSKKINNININLINTHESQIKNIVNNIQNHKIENVNIIFNKLINKSNTILFYDNSNNINDDLVINYNNTIIICKYDNSLLIKYKNVYCLKNTNYFIYVPDNYKIDFEQYFKYYIDNENNINYDNLIHLCIMVKNGGDQFESMLKENMDIIDRWTILDTGSTDNTIDIIKRTLVDKKKGELYEEPFINFRDSRNRCLELAGKSCKFILTLDDTYVINGNLRNILNIIRGDQISSSFTLIINSNDSDYGSNRIIKSQSGLRYKFKIHEVIDDNNNVNILIPKEDVFIEDRRFDYMERRTMDRKQLDLKLLYEEIEEDPTNPRHYYYLAQTYNILEDYENAYKYYLKRGEFTNSGFIQERIDAIFEAARCANFKLNKSWEECMELYEKAFKIDETRPESLYFIGIHYYLEGNHDIAYKYFKRAFKIGYPNHCQYSLKPTLSFYFLPKFLAQLCYNNEDFKLGEEVCELFLRNNKIGCEYYNVMNTWYNIFQKLNLCPNKSSIKNINVPDDKPLFIFVADGGFYPWSGKNIITTGVGGSETYIIEHARNIQRSGKYNVIVFCNTPNGEDELFEDVQYKHLNKFYNYVMENYIHTCIVSRFSEYLPVCYYGNVENVYLVVHDLTPSGEFITINKKLKNIFCLTEWHVEYMTNIYPELKELIVSFYYGIDFTNFKNNNITKIKNKFIYSSYPNRGLLELLQIWPVIWENHKDASLYLFCDVNNKWSNDVEPDKMNEIKKLLELYGVDYKNRKNNENNKLNIYYKGWVSKKELANEWLSADIWFYPCTFMETFCLTALEAAITKTLVITNDLAALQNTVGDRGVIIKGDCKTEEWKKEAIVKVLEYMNMTESEKLKIELINKNYEWAEKMSWEDRTNELLCNYILKNEYEYKGMYNWTNDLPKGSKKVFEEVIEYFNSNYKKGIHTESEKIRILEIGTYTGISLIEIVKRIPNSIGIGIDMWSPYNENELLENIKNLKVEESFHKNIKISFMEDKIIGIKGDSKDILIEMIKKGDNYDFVYVDGSHLCIDCYIDLLLSWELLNKGGILAIDDYLYKKYDENILNSPYEGVNHFMNKYQSKYKVLHKDYRVFLEKL